MSASKLINVAFQTSRYAPNNVVTLICDDSLKGRVVHGTFHDQAWHYELLLQPGRQTTIRFRLNDEAEMEQHPFQLSANGPDRTWSEESVSFPRSSHQPRYIHHIDRLLTEDNDFQRKYIPSNLDQTLEYDVIVIGSGMGGGIVADALSDCKLNVLVLEGGSVHLPQNVVNVPVPNRNATRYCVSYTASADDPNSALTKDICMNFGGRSIYWSALIPRMSRHDIKAWPAEIQAYFTKAVYQDAETLFRKRTEFNGFQRRWKRKLQRRFLDYDVQHTPRSYHSLESTIPRRRGKPDEIPTGAFSTAALLLNSLTFPGGAGKDHLTINLNHLVSRIYTQGRNATWVECQDLINNCVRVYKAKHVVLAAGATESPCIAMRSGIRDVSGKIGVGLTDHQVAEINFDIPPDWPGFSSDDQAKFLLRPRFPTRIRGQFSCELALNWRFWDVRYEDDDLFEQDLPEGHPIHCTIKFVFGSPLNENNWIRDHPGKHLIHVEHMNGRPYEADIDKMRKRVLRFFGARDQPAYSAPLNYRVAAESLHAGGSLRMGKRKDAVVDPNLRFHEYDNLYCCDLSVFPYIPIANPALTLGVLARRLAHHIAGECTKQAR